MRRPHLLISPSFGVWNSTFEFCNGSKHSDHSNYLPMDFGQTLRSGEIQCDIASSQPAAEDVSNKHFVVLTNSLSPAQRLTSQKSMKQEIQRKPKATKPEGRVRSIRAQQPLAGLPLTQDRKMCMHSHHVNFHIPPLPLQMPSVVRPCAGREQRDHSEAALQFKRAAFTRLSQKPSSCRRSLGEGKFKDEDPAAPHSRGPGWRMASIRESC